MRYEQFFIFHRRAKASLLLPRRTQVKPLKKHPTTPFRSAEQFLSRPYFSRCFRMIEMILSQCHIAIDQILSRFPSPRSFPPLYEIQQVASLIMTSIAGRKDAFDSPFPCAPVFAIALVFVRPDSHDFLYNSKTVCYGNLRVAQTIGYGLCGKAGPRTPPIFVSSTNRTRFIVE